jgi:hypothetical protein
MTQQEKKRFKELFGKKEEPVEIWLPRRMEVFIKYKPIRK